MGWGKPGGNNERECGCCIEIKDSIVIITCGEIEIDRLKNCLQTALEAKDDEKTS